MKKLILLIILMLSGCESDFIHACQFACQQSMGVKIVDVNKKTCECNGVYTVTKEISK